MVSTLWYARTPKVSIAAVGPGLDVSVAPIHDRQMGYLLAIPVRRLPRLAATDQSIAVSAHQPELRCRSDDNR